MIKQNIAENVDQAKDLIINNRVLVNGSLQNNLNSTFDVSVQVSLTREAKQYVSRGGFKLEKALNEFHLDVQGLKALDVGASTGGFTDCLLQHGAEHVIAIDVGRSQLDEKIRKHENVKIFERLNAKDLTLEQTDGPCDICVIDVSFTSVLPLMDSIERVLKAEAPIVVLIKPQFEAKKGQVGDDGIVKDVKDHIEILSDFIKDFPSPYFLNALVASPITGAKGNIEFLGLFERSKKNTKIDIEDIVNDAHKILKDNDDK